MYTLGINEGHNASAALFMDGKLIAAVSEERITRKKNEYGYPEKAINYCLTIGGISSNLIDRVALASFDLPPKYFHINRNANLGIEDYWKEQREYWYPRLYLQKDVSYLEVFKDKIDPKALRYDFSLTSNENDSIGMLEARLKNIINSLGVTRKQISVYDHHKCHSYYGFYSCPEKLDNVLVFVSDGFGDGINGSIWVSEKGNPPEQLISTDKCNIGRIYRYITLLLGMKQNDHEYKVMGLAPYSNETIGKKSYEIFLETLYVDGLNFKYSKEIIDHFFYFKDKLEGQRFDGIAWGLQKWTEELLCEWIKNWVVYTRIPNIVFCGGVAQNIKANKKIWEANEVNFLYVPLAPGDESLSIGAAYVDLCNNSYQPHSGLIDIQPIVSAYCGREYTSNEICEFINSISNEHLFNIRKTTNHEVSLMLSKGEIIARHYGKMEFGPRALGNRSIIADPRSKDVVKNINEIIKQRDFWMPFAFSIIEDCLDDYIYNPKGLISEYMTIAFDSTTLARDHLISGLHPYDYTARPQIVRREVNPEYYDLILHFKEITGVGGLLNTSFNLHGEPIVESPYDAFETFKKSGLNHVQIGDWMISKIV